MVDPNSVKSIFLAALEKPPAQRDSFLEQAAGGDAALRARVEALLKAHDDPNAFLDKPAVAFGATADLSPAEPPLTERPGTLIGPYKLLEQIGEGGMGVVYMAEQQTPVRRRVALKIIKAGMDTRQVIARFEAERQALAMMDHSNIARVLDAGATESGRPYFVMELVRGIPITEYCDQNNLPVQARLELFVQVCHAVQHAHQKGIIHRDLKPSNVLVTVDDGRAVPKIIDFGVAKATNQQLTEKTLFTAFAQMIGTPMYMSPEQAEMTSLDIDTRSDIYSLGVLLYELLAGTTPFDQERLRTAAFDEIRRIIREEEPPPPSARISTLRDARETTAAHRQVEFRRLSQLVAGDLDWIVMRCLEKDRQRRYETANGLAADISRHLSNLPVEARRPTQIYRLKKFIRRNRAAVLAGLTIVAALLVGLTVATIGFVDARRQAVRADHEADNARTQAARADTEAAHARIQAARSEQVAQFLEAMLKGVGPSVALGRDTTMLREIVDQTAQRVSADLKDEPEVQIQLLQTLTQVYLDLALTKKAEETARETLRLARLHLGEENIAVADSMNQLGRALFYLRQLDEAEAVTRQAIAMERKLRGSDSLEEAAAKLNLCDVLRRQWSDTDISNADRSKPEEAEASIRECLAIRRKRLGDVHNDVAWALDALSILLHGAFQGRLDEAEAASRESVAIRQKLYGDDHPHLAASYFFLANVLRSKNNLAEAELCYRKALSIERKSSAPDTYWHGIYLQGIVTLLQQEGKFDEAITYQREGLMNARQRLGKDNPILADAILSLAELLFRNGERVESRQLAEEAVILYRGFPTMTRQLSNALADLANILVSSEEFAAAEPAARECLEIREKQIPDNWSTFNARSLLGAALLGQKQYADAEPFLLSGYEGLKQREDKMSKLDKRCLKKAVQRLLKLYEATDQAEKAAQWQEKLAEFDKPQAAEQ